MGAELQAIQGQIDAVDRAIADEQKKAPSPYEGQNFSASFD
jgi:hypothetical protein